ncbi:hypothetical protein DUNSADRAFT_18267 [Dunaliella salina]|uniref:RNase H type-1 domain-containing protein n=1 Tax=Dunaliella salina TaxID=3046 RepID=A0ABQ7G0D4_DUNSA|nr:hypothetical protein DUNSADRAFT_18267 [Dunaliella salina]|eukprot:KAF5828068.1 hypothetical protein DUNSADRAFT_18267 [Dunaliella salina]
MGDGQQAVPRAVPVIDLTANDDSDHEEGRRTPAPKHLPKGPGNENAPTDQPLPSPQSLQPTLILDVDGSGDRGEELSSAHAHELMSTGPQGTPQSVGKRTVGGPSSSGPSGSRKRPCLSPGQHPRQQPGQQLQFQEGQVNQAEQPMEAPGRQAKQRKQQHQAPAPANLQAQAPSGLPSQLEQPHQGPEVDQGSQVAELLSDTPFKLMKMRMLLPPHQNKFCCGGDPAELVAPVFLQHAPGHQVLRILPAQSSNMCPDIDWLLRHAPHMAHAEHLVIVHGVSNETALEPLRERLLLGDPPLMPPRTHLTMHRCPLPYDYGTQHAKYIVLQYTTGLRFILHTANPLKGTDDISVQAMYHQDFPPKDNLSPPSSDFEETFCDYVEQMRLPPAEQDLILKAIRLHDFSSARVFLVPSVPGQHSGSALHKYGHMRLRHLLQQHLDAAPLPRAGVANPGRRGTLSSLFRNSASGASHSGQGQRDVPEGIIVQPTSIGRLNSNWFYNDFGASLCAAKSPPLKVPLRKAKPVQPKPLTPDAAYFVWPSYEGIRSSVGGWSSGGNVHATTANMEKDGKFLFPLLHHFSGEAASRAECMPHMKSFCRFKGQQLAYAIVGSHNLSIAAWGGPPRKDSQDVLMIRSYELSVLMLPVLETAYRRHRHYKFSCTPAGDLPVSRVPQPQRNGVYKPGRDTAPPSQHLQLHIKPNGHGPTNTITRAELVGILVALQHEQTEIATDSASYLFQISDQSLHPMRMRYHLHAELIHAISTILEHSPHPIHFYKVKAHSGIIGNEGADACARTAALSHTIDIALPDARNPFRDSYRLSLKISSTRNDGMHRSHTFPIHYLTNLSDKFKTYMHKKHKLGSANTSG